MKTFRVVAAVLALCCCGCAVFGCAEDPPPQQQQAIYIEISGAFSIGEEITAYPLDVVLSEEEIAAMLQAADPVLRQYYYEDETYACFLDETFVYDLSGAAAIAAGAIALQDEAALQALKQRLEADLAVIDATRFSALDCYDYLYLCDVLGLEIGCAEEIRAILSARVREDYKIVYLSDPEESLGRSLSLTCKLQEYADVLGLASSAWEQEIARCFEEFAFVPYTEGVETTFYNAGGYVVSALNCFGLWDAAAQAETRAWAESWKSYYDALPLSDTRQVVQCSQFYEVYEQYDAASVPASRLTEAFCAFTAEEWLETDSWVLIAAALRYVPVQEGEPFRTLASSLLHEGEGFLLKDGYFSVKNTYGGLGLSDKLDAGWVNIQKIKTFLEEVCFAAALQAEGTATSARLLADSVAAHQWINVIHGKEAVWDLAEEYEERFGEAAAALCKALESVPDAKYFEALTDVTDLYLYGFMNNTIPLDVNAIRARVERMYEEGSLSLQDASWAYRITRNIRTGKLPSLAQQEGFVYEQKELLDWEESFRVYGRYYAEDGSALYEGPATLDRVAATLRLAGGIYADPDLPKGYCEDDPEVLIRTKINEACRRMQRNIEGEVYRLLGDNVLFAEEEGGRITPYSASMSFRSDYWRWRMPEYGEG